MIETNFLFLLLVCPFERNIPPPISEKLPFSPMVNLYLTRSIRRIIISLLKYSKVRIIRPLPERDLNSKQVSRPINTETYIFGLYCIVKSKYWKYWWDDAFDQEERVKTWHIILVFTTFWSYIDLYIKKLIVACLSIINEL